MHRGIMRMMRPPGYPFIPFLFPMGMVMVMMGLTTWFTYQNWKELEAIKRAGVTGSSPP